MIFLGCLKISWTDSPVCVCAECPPGPRPLIISDFVSFTSLLSMKMVKMGCRDEVS